MGWGGSAFAPNFSETGVKLKCLYVSYILYITRQQHTILTNSAILYIIVYYILSR